MKKLLVLSLALLSVTGVEAWNWHTGFLKEARCAQCGTQMKCGNCGGTEANLVKKAKKKSEGTKTTSGINRRKKK